MKELAVRSPFRTGDPRVDHRIRVTRETKQLAYQARQTAPYELPERTSLRGGVSPESVNVAATCSGVAGRPSGSLSGGAVTSSVQTVNCFNTVVPNEVVKAASTA